MSPTDSPRRASIGPAIGLALGVVALATGAIVLRSYGPGTRPGLP
jgi:hypothetical protein